MILNKIRALWASSDNRPPNLDEIWRDLTRQIKGIFGTNNPYSEPTPTFSNDRSPKSSGRFILFILSGLFVIWLATGFYIIDETQRGIVLRFGKFVEETESGLHWHWPFPIEKYFPIELTTIRKVNVGYKDAKDSLMLTDDENIVSTQFIIQYNLKDAKDFAFNNRFNDLAGDDAGTDLVRQVAETAIREVVGKSKMDYVLYEGREQIAQQTRNLMQQILDRYHAGIRVTSVTMQNAQPPEKVQAAFSDAVKAGQDRERQKNEGQAYANDVIPKAEGTQARLLEEARGYRDKVIATAEGDASRFNQILIEYSKSPNVMKQRLYIDAMEGILRNAGKVMIDTKSTNPMVYLPLDKLNTSKGSESAPPPVVQSAPVSPFTSTENNSSSNVEDAAITTRNRGSRP